MNEWYPTVPTLRTEIPGYAWVKIETEFNSDSFINEIE